jgi:cold shock CspA family protein
LNFSKGTLFNRASWSIFNETLGFAWLLADAAYVDGFVHQSAASFGGRGPNEWTLG